jgi:hypothetical protein
MENALLPSRGKDICHLEENILKRGREKGGKCERKGRTG